MAAGQGFKTFATGDVLTAADTNGYLMQGVWVFADAAARTAAVTSPQEGNMSFLKDTNSTEYYSGSAWVAVGAASGGMTLLSTTTLSGTSTTISITPTGYNSLYILTSGVVCSGNADFYAQLNSVTSSDYLNHSIGNRLSTAQQFSGNYNGCFFTFQGVDGYGTTSENTMELQIPDPNGTKKKIMSFYSTCVTPSSAGVIQFGMSNANCTAAISSIKFILGSSQTFSAGTVKVYGVK